MAGLTVLVWSLWLQQLQNVVYVKMQMTVGQVADSAFACLAQLMIVVFVHLRVIVERCLGCHS
jgi:hypothetical protein